MGWPRGGGGAMGIRGTGAKRGVEEGVGDRMFDYTGTHVHITYMYMYLHTM